MQMCIWLEVKKNDQQLWLARGRWTQGPQRVEPCGLERKNALYQLGLGGLFIAQLCLKVLKISGVVDRGARAH